MEERHDGGKGDMLNELIRSLARENGDRRDIVMEF